MRRGRGAAADVVNDQAAAERELSGRSPTHSVAPQQSDPLRVCAAFMSSWGCRARQYPRWLRCRSVEAPLPGHFVQALTATAPDRIWRDRTIGGHARSRRCRVSLGLEQTFTRRPPPGRVTSFAATRRRRSACFGCTYYNPGVRRDPRGLDRLPATTVAGHKLSRGLKRACD